MKMLKRKMESRVGSDMDCRPEDDGINGYETRGVGSWFSTSAQGNLPVPTEFRPSIDAVKENVALSTITEAQFREMLSSAFKVTNGSNHLQGFVGIDMKNQIDNWTSYQDDVTGKIRCSLNDKASLRQLIQVVERIQLSGGTVDLHPTIGSSVTRMAVRRMRRINPVYSCKWICGSSVMCASHAS